MKNIIKRFLKQLYINVFYVMGYVKIFRKFGYVGKQTVIRRPMRIVNGKRIKIGRQVFIMDGLRIEAVSKWGAKFTPRILIGDQVTIGQNCHFTCAGTLRIGTGCSVMPDVLITDIEHMYDYNRTLGETGLKAGSVSIGAYTVIGMGARILGSKNIIIGRNVVIGANAVVTHDIPDGAVVAGIPARIIRYR